MTIFQEHKDEKLPVSYLRYLDVLKTTTSKELNE